MNISEEMIYLLEEEYKGMSVERLTELLESLKSGIANTLSMLRRVNIDPIMVDATSVKSGVERMLLNDYYSTLVKMAAAKKVLRNQVAVR